MPARITPKIEESAPCGYPFFLAANKLLSHLWHFAHRAQTARADIDGTRSAIDFETAALYIEHKTTTCSMLRVGNIIAIHWLPLTDITTTCGHFYLPS